jgi:hypothetical protein
MREKEQLALRSMPLTRRMKVSGGLAAMSLGELQGPSRPVSRHICKNHRWRQSRWSRQCNVCGLVEDKAG